MTTITLGSLSVFAGRLVRYIAGTFRRPIATLEAIAHEPGIRWGVAIAILKVVQVWGNMVLFAAFGYDWLGTRPLLPDPTYVGGFGYLRVNAGDWLPIFAALLPVLMLFDLALGPAIAQILGKAHQARGSFEQLVNVLAFASVPALAIGWLSEWITGVPMNLLSGHRYWFVAAMQGEFGPTLAAIWNVYAVTVYAAPWIWGIALGTIGIRIVQQVPLWWAALTMVVVFTMSMLVTTTFVR